MKYLQYVILSFLLIAVSCRDGIGGNDVIMSNAQFSVTGDSVVQGEYVAYAPSRTMIVSNYVDTASTSYHSPIPLRLAFNMRDNELPSGIFHLADISQDTIFITACKPDSTTSYPQRTISPDTHVTVKVDLRDMTKAFKDNGVYITGAGDSIFADEFNGVWLLGGIPPLSWELMPLAFNNRSKLRKSEDEGFYELDLTLSHSEYLRKIQFTGWSTDRIKTDYPEVTSSDLLIDALYNMAVSTISDADLSELSVSQLSLATVMMLADVKPEVCQQQLRKKVHNGIIIQDHIGRFTFPIVNDRMVWAAAAWQVYCATGSKKWLEYARNVILNTLDVVNPIIFCDQLYMVHGCDSYSSPESQYPRWMQPKDYFESIKMSNNVTYAYCYNVLSQMDDELGLDSDAHYSTFQRIKNSINQYMWNEQLGRYCSYLMHEAFPMQSGTTCNIAQAAAILFDITDDDRASALLSHTPFYITGIPAIYPSNYAHPDGYQLAFTQGMWNLAAAKCGNTTMLHHGLAALYRSVAFKGFGNNDSGERFLNACATAAMTIRLTAGITMSPEGVEFNPVVPACFPSDKSIKNFHYRNATFDITIHGTGNSIQEFELDGKPQNTNFVSADISGRHKIDITLTEGSNRNVDQRINLTTPSLRPFTPDVTWKGDSAIINNFSSQYHYSVTVNSHTFSGIHRVFPLPSKGTGMNVVYVTCRQNLAQSHASRPHLVISQSSITEYPLCAFAKAGTSLFEGPSSKSVVEFCDRNVKSFSVDAIAPQPGNYYIDVLYSNGSTTTSITPICKVWVNTHPQDVLVMPQQGVNQWRTFAYSNMIEVPLLRGHNTIRLQYDVASNNIMNYPSSLYPTVLLRTLRLIKK